MFRVATNMDLAGLKDTIGDVFPPSYGFDACFGLKNFGYMLALRELSSIAGSIRPTAFDLSSSPDPHFLARAADISWYIAKDVTRVADASIDFTCYIAGSAFEARPSSDYLLGQCSRIMRRGAITVQTLNVTRRDRAEWTEYQLRMANSGFKFKEPLIDIDLTKDGILHEPPGILINHYEKTGCVTSLHFNVATIFAVATKV